MREHLETLIYVCRERLEAVESERIALADELRNYERMLGATTDLQCEEYIVRRLGVSPAWLAVLTELRTYRRFRAEDIIRVSGQLHSQQETIKVPTRGNVRFQLSKYVTKRLVDRLGGGNYRLNKKCSAAIEVLCALKTSHSSRTTNTRNWVRAAGSDPTPAGDAR
jgi:hypothetical protein